MISGYMIIIYVFVWSLRVCTGSALMTRLVLLFLIFIAVTMIVSSDL